MERRTLSCRLTDSELKLKAEGLAARVQERDVVEDEAKDVAAVFKTKIKAIDADVSLLAYQVRTRTEQRDVDCQWERDDARSMMVLVRLDTGEIADTRQMTREERQPSLFQLSDAK